MSVQETMFDEFVGAKTTADKPKRVPRKPRKSPSRPAAVTPKPEGPRVIAAEEALADGTILCQFVIPGQAVTKKTSQRKTRFGILPSLQYVRYEAQCAPHCLAAWVGKGRTADEWEEALVQKYAGGGRPSKRDAEQTPIEIAHRKMPNPKERNVWDDFPQFVARAPMDYGVCLCMRVYLATWQVGDCTGYQQSIADILQKYGVIANDAWLHWDWEGAHWFGGKDVENPRVEITLTRFRHPKEAFRAEQEAEEEAKQERKTERECKARAKESGSERNEDASPDS